MYEDMDQRALSVPDLTAALSSILAQAVGKDAAVWEPAFSATVTGLYDWHPRADVDAAVQLARARTRRDVARA